MTAAIICFVLAAIIGAAMGIHGRLMERAALHQSNAKALLRVPDYDLIRQLEIECGIVEAPPKPVRQGMPYIEGADIIIARVAEERAFQEEQARQRKVCEDWADEAALNQKEYTGPQAQRIPLEEHRRAFIELYDFIPTFEELDDFMRGPAQYADLPRTVELRTMEGGVIRKIYS